MTRLAGVRRCSLTCFGDCAFDFLPRYYNVNHFIQPTEAFALLLSSRVIMAEPAEEEPVVVAEEEEDFVPVGGATEIKLFGKWSFDDIEVRDISLVVRA